MYEWCCVFAFIFVFKSLPGKDIYWHIHGLNYFISGFDLICSRKENVWGRGNMFNSSQLSFRSTLHPSMPCTLPKEPDLRDCLSRNLLASGFQYKTPAEEGRVRREDKEIGVGHNLRSKVIASLKAACST